MRKTFTKRRNSTSFAFKLKGLFLCMLSLFAWESVRAQCTLGLLTSGGTGCTGSYRIQNVWMQDDNFPLPYVSGGGQQDPLNIPTTGKACSTGSPITDGYDNRTLTAQWSKPVVTEGGRYEFGVLVDGMSNPNGSGSFMVWIDMDQDGDFSPSEVVTPGPISYSAAGNNWALSYIDIPMLTNFPNTITGCTDPGDRYMRVRATDGTPLTIYNGGITLGADGETHDYVIEIKAAPPCTGAPNILSVTGDNITLTGSNTTNHIYSFMACAGQTSKITVNLPVMSNMQYTWYKIDPISGNPVPLAGSPNSPSLTFPNITGSIAGIYQLEAYCQASGQVATAIPSITIDVNEAKYLKPPYLNDFENWVGFCGSGFESPLSSSADTNVTLNPNYNSEASWRRNDQGGDGGWVNDVIGRWQASGGTPTAISGNYAARFHSAGAGPSTSGEMLMYFDMSHAGADTNYQINFYYINKNVPGGNGDTLFVLMSRDNGSNFDTLAKLDTLSTWRKHAYNFSSASDTTIIKFKAVRASNVATDQSDIGLDSVYIARGCTGTPVAGTISSISGTTTICAGQRLDFINVGASMGGNLVYEWQQSTNAGATWTPLGGKVHGGLRVISEPFFFPTSVRMIVRCGTTGAPVASNVINVQVNNSPMYATLPFFESFETWKTRCLTNDVPDNDHWVALPNPPADINAAWRRNDQGAAAGWSNATRGVNAPEAIDSNYSARYHRSVAGDKRGELNLFVDLSGAGDKELRFYLKGGGGGGDGVDVALSEDGGKTFGKTAVSVITPNLGNPIVNADSVWKYYRVNLASASSSSVIRFTATAPGSMGSPDIYLDAVEVVPPCSGTPTAGYIDSVIPCASQAFTMEVKGQSANAGLQYQWYESPNNTTYTPITGATYHSYTTTLNSDMYYYVVVTCGTNSDTTPVFLAKLGAFYYCYCNTGIPIAPGSYDIGRVVLHSNLYVQDTIINNGSATPSLNNASATKMQSSFFSGVPGAVYRDTTYRLVINQINSNNTTTASKATVFIDYNRDGIYDANTETVGTVNLSSNTGTIIFKIPATAQIGFTGMRIMLSSSTATITPCGAYTGGETEDYVLDIRYPKCTGPVNAGTTIVSDSISCVGYDVDLINTTYHSTNSGIERVWQQSPDNFTWGSLPGSNNKDTFSNPVLGDYYYRLRTVCTYTKDTTYSNIVQVMVGEPYQCYCFATASGSLDSSDIGTFKIEHKYIRPNYLYELGGTHLQNPRAVKGRTDYTKPPFITLVQDSTYDFSVYHTSLSRTHSDARISVFIDYDDSRVYEPTERVLTGTTTALNFMFTGTVTIPTFVTTYKPLGMRIILNDNLDPNHAVNATGCGEFESGEVEDYVVYILPSTNVGLEEYSLVDNLVIYPNPAKKEFFINFKTKIVAENAKVEIVNATGQVVFSENFSVNATSFSQRINIGDIAAGMYMVNLIVDGEKTVTKLVIE